MDETDRLTREEARRWRGELRRLAARGDELVLLGEIPGNDIRVRGR